MLDVVQKKDTKTVFGSYALKPDKDELQSSPLLKADSTNKLKTFIDLFCGIGGFHSAASRLNLECVFACDIDSEARRAYEYNFNMKPAGDITAVNASDIPEHDILCAGFPCQPFSIIGGRKGFSDPRGTLFFEILRILREKRPKAFVLENVRQLATINKKETLNSIIQSLKDLGYHTEYKILNALDFGLPQKRERILIVGTLKNIGSFPWCHDKIKMKPLSEILEDKPDEKHFVSDRIKEARKNAHSPKVTPSIWHENKSGNISSHPFSCALRAGASYNYLLVNGERRLTPREMLRLQGFSDEFEIICSDSQTRKQAGNSVPVPMIHFVLKRLIETYEKRN